MTPPTPHSVAFASAARRGMNQKDQSSPALPANTATARRVRPTAPQSRSPKPAIWWPVLVTRCSCTQPGRDRLADRQVRVSEGIVVRLSAGGTGKEAGEPVVEVEQSRGSGAQGVYVSLQGA